MRAHDPQLFARAALDEFWNELVRCDRDLPALLLTIAQRVVNIIGDGCVLTTLTTDRSHLQPVVVLHSDDAVADAMRAVLGGSTVAMGEGIAGTAAQDRRAVMLNDLPPETVGETTPSRFLPFVRDHPMRALMIVPMVAAGQLVGTLGAVRTETFEGYTPTDLRHLEALAERAAMAIADALTGPRAVDPWDYQAIFHHSLDGVLLTTPDGHILAANPAACSILGMSEQQLLEGGRHAVVVAEDPNLATGLTRRAASGHTRGELMLRRGDDTTLVADVSSTIFTTANGQLRASVIFRDVTQTVAARQEADIQLAALQEAADRDPLTGLLNRRGFGIAADHALATADREEHVAQVIFLDIDALKPINDAHGHAAGDRAILSMASAIRSVSRDADAAGRLGGDEFALVAVDLHDADVEAVVARIRRELENDPTAPSQLTFSTGRAERRPRSQQTLQALIDTADRDMYQHRMLRRLRGQGDRPGE